MILGVVRQGPSRLICCENDRRLSLRESSVPITTRLRGRDDDNGDGGKQIDSL